MTAGTGMNEDELKRNTVLTDYSVKDLNEDPHLPYDDATFDVRALIFDAVLHCSVGWPPTVHRIQPVLAQLLQYCSARAATDEGIPSCIASQAAAIPCAGHHQHGQGGLPHQGELSVRTSVCRAESLFLLLLLPLLAAVAWWILFDLASSACSP